MKKITYISERNIEFDIFIAEDVFKDRSGLSDKDTARETYDDVEELFPKYLEPDFEKFFMAYAKRYKLPQKLCILNAHEIDGKEWTMLDGDKGVPVQTFANEVDGKYACIFLLICNVQDKRAVFTKSCSVFGDNYIGLMRKIQREYEQIACRPLPKNEILDHYMIAYDTRELLGRKELMREAI